MIMDEKKIISGEKYDIKKIRTIIFAAGACSSVLGIFVSDPWHFLSADYLRRYGADAALTSILLGILIFGVPFFVLGAIFYAWMSKVELNVTDKRVYGCTAFGKRVDLPIDSVSAVGIGILKTISVTTASGAIKFGMIKNRDAIHEAISKLLVERQSKPVATTTVKQEIAQSSADELKKYKDLLDSGIISQEEFDSKKNQLLGM